MPRNFTDKSLYNAGTTEINNTNAVQVGQVSGMFAAQGIALTFGNQDDIGKRTILAATDNFANFTYPANGTLYEGVYQLVQVSAAATSTNVGTGRAAYWNLTATGYQVTDEAHATALSLKAGVFLNSITPGNYGFIFVGGGRVTVQYKTGLTNGTPAVGDNIVLGGGLGTFDDAAAGSAAPTGNFMGVATTLPTSAGQGVIYMPNLLNRL